MASLKWDAPICRYAVPILLSQEFEAYARVLRRDIKRVKATRENLYEVNMGATAVGDRPECRARIY